MKPTRETVVKVRLLYFKSNKPTAGLLI